MALEGTNGQADPGAPRPAPTVPGPGIGEPVPWFSAPTHSRPDFAFSSVGGYFALLAFLPSDPARHAGALAAVRRNLDQINDERLLVFLVVSDADAFAAGQEAPGLRWFFDPDREIARLYGRLTAQGDVSPAWMLIDPTLRLMMLAPYDQADEMFARLRRLPSPDAHAGVAINAPVLIVPRVLEPEICRRLIGIYSDGGGAPSGVMRDIDGKTVGVLDDFKKRRDAVIEDQAVRNALNGRIKRRLAPEIEKAFQWEPTRIERYIVACYDAGEGGYFRPHRDNTTAGTAHRKFAVSINLNAEEFEGGDLRFPEFGSRTYRPPTGGAVVFSCSLLHEATAVTKGTRYAFLPFLFDEAGEAIRMANQHRISNQAAEAPAPKA